jgi:hypothetical protein
MRERIPTHLERQDSGPIDIVSAVVETVSRN